MNKNTTLKSFNNDSIATDTYLKKYALKDNEDNLLEYTLEQTIERLINGNLKAETEDDISKRRGEFKFLFKYFMSGGRTTYALGNPYDLTSTFFNCYVGKIEDDSINGIFNMAKKQAKIFSRGGGIGFDLSILRPDGAKVNNSAKTTSGAISFMDLYSYITNIIGQNGRRGALMLTMNIDHPEILKFIKVKGGKNKDKISGANISVKINNKFMELLLSNPDADWIMEFTTVKNEYIIRKEKVSTIWEALVESNWQGAEPGILFWDNILNNDPASIFDETRPISTNPCGEEPLSAWESCNLGSLLLPNFVNNSFTDKAEFDFENFKKAVKYATRFLDNLNTLNYDRQPLKENKLALKLGNRIGLGINGLADMLIKMNLKYDTDEAIDFVDKVFYCLKKETILASIELARERGICGVLEKYKNTDKYKEWYNHKYFDILGENEKKLLIENGSRNIGYNTCAPNGTIAIVERQSSGIEPIFSLSYERTVNQGSKTGKSQTYIVYHPLVEEYDKIFGKDSHKQNPNFITSKDIDWMKRVKLQSVIQSHISQSISSTINLPKETTKEVISNIYKESYKQGLKGITIYRDSSRDGVLKSIEDKKNFSILDEYEYPSSGEAKYKVIRSEDRKWYIHYSIDSETKLPNSIFVNTNATETTILTEDVIEQLIKLAKKYIKNKYIEELQEKSHKQTNVTKIARTLGLLLRHRVPIIEIVKTIESINPPISSFVFQIKKLLSDYIEGEFTGDKCPECDSQMIYESGCCMCRQCGYTKCG